MRDWNSERYENYWKTAISRMDQNTITIRGYLAPRARRRDLVRRHRHPCCAGELPIEESKVVNSSFTSVIARSSIRPRSRCASDVVQVIDEYYPTEAIDAPVEGRVNDYLGRRGRNWGFGHPLHLPVNEHYTYRSQLCATESKRQGSCAAERWPSTRPRASSFRRGSGNSCRSTSTACRARFSRISDTSRSRCRRRRLSASCRASPHTRSRRSATTGSPLRIVSESEYVGPPLRSVDDKPR